MTSCNESNSDKSPFSPPPAFPIPVLPMADLTQLGSRLVQWPSNTEPLGTLEQVALQVACLTLALTQALRRLSELEARQRRRGYGRRH